VRIVHTVHPLKGIHHIITIYYVYMQWLRFRVICLYNQTDQTETIYLLKTVNSYLTLSLLRSIILIKQ